MAGDDEEQKSPVETGGEEGEEGGKKRPAETQLTKEENGSKDGGGKLTAVKEALTNLITEKSCGPILIRLAWHDAGTYDAKTNTGGPRGCMRFEGTTGEASFGANAGLDVARKLLQPIKDGVASEMTTADFWALAGMTAVKVMGGPDITFRSGRKDDPVEKCVEEGRHPDGDKGADHLRAVFGRMGLSDQDIVALSGAHTVGKCHADRSGFEGPWTADPLKFDNSYYIDLLNKTWMDSTSSKGCPQLKEKDSTNDLMMLLSDRALVDDDKFKVYVERYAKDQEAFFTDFASAFQKLLELGYDDLKET